MISDAELARLKELAANIAPRRCSGYTRCCDHFYYAEDVEPIRAAVPALIAVVEAARKVATRGRQGLFAWNDLDVLTDAFAALDERGGSHLVLGVLGRAPPKVDR